MLRLRTIAALTALAALAVGCANDPLTGTWTAATTSGTYRFTTTLTLGEDGALAVSDEGSGACTGARRYAGLTWSRAEATATVTFGGTSVCTGAITCTSAGTTTALGCPTGAGSPLHGACGYTLSGDGSSLTLQACSGGGAPTTYRRVGE